jgi:hypothetical protein
MPDTGIPVTIGSGVSPEPEAGDPVVGAGRVVRVDQLVLCEAGADGDAEQPSLPARVGLLDDVDLGDVAASGHAHDPPGVALADQRAAVREERQAPRRPQPGGQDLGWPATSGGGSVPGGAEGDGLGSSGADDTSAVAGTDAAGPGGAGAAASSRAGPGDAARRQQHRVAAHRAARRRLARPPAWILIAAP